MPLVAQQSVPPAIDTYVQKTMREWQVPGLALAVVRNDSLLFAKGYGVRELGKPEPFDANTVFAIASSTKSFTSAALGMLVDEGKLRWDDHVTTHLPSFQLSDPSRTADFRVRDLLVHRAGVLRADPLWMETGYSRDEIVRRMRYAPVVAGFRERMGYTNVMYIIAGQVLATISGMSWDDFVRTRIFEPLGMRSTSTSIRDLPRFPNVATPHRLVDGRPQPMEWMDLDNEAAGGAINSTAIDMAQWLRLQLGGGVYNGRRLLSDTVIRDLRTPHTPSSLRRIYGDLFRGEGHFYTYALGWYIQDYRGSLMIEHQGALNGARAEVALFPDEDLGVFVFGNLRVGDQPDYINALTYRIFDELTGKPRRDWSPDMLAINLDRRNIVYDARGQFQGYQSKNQNDQAHRAQDVGRLPNTRPSLPLDAYPGIYDDSLYGALTVERRGDALSVEWFGPSEVRGTLKHWHLDTFYVDEWTNPILRNGQRTFFSFIIGVDGRPAELRVEEHGTFLRRRDAPSRKEH